MTFRSLVLRTSVFSLLLAVFGVFTFPTVTAQDKTDKAKISEAEAKAVKTVEGAADIDAKLTAAADFVKKYPRSNARKSLAEYVADQIVGTRDGEQKLAQAKRFQMIFTASAEADAIQPALIDGYLKLNRID